MNINMTVVKTAEDLNALSPKTLMGHLGITYLSVEYGKIRASMPVVERTMQPFGRLHGGASIALAESVTSAGSYAIVNEKLWHVLGSEVSASHLSVASGGIVYAEAQLLHEGKLHHIWEVKIVSDRGRLISVCRITNTLIPAK
jgi:uncharacterized protein (TIGR00369 family)